MFRLRGVLDGKGPGASSVTDAAMDGGDWRDGCPSPGHVRTAVSISYLILALR